jgi:cysteine-S-conjugate beta-lyase
MNYNFDELVNRKGTDCVKYDELLQIFGKEDLIPMWVADTDFKTPDFIVDAVKKRAEHEIYGYPIIPDSYYESIQNWILNQHSWKIEKEWINYCPNVVIALASLVLSLTKPGDKIIVQPPVYFPFFHVVEGNDRTMVENQLKIEDGRYVFNFEDLKSKIDEKTKMLILCSPHNPGGRVWTKEELTELGRICIEKNIIIVSDEIHSDLIFPEYKHTPIANISEEFSQNCITTMAASKTFNIAGLSSAYVIIKNKELQTKFKRFMQATHISSGNFFGQVATEAAYTHGADWLSQLMVYLDGNWRIVDEFFKQNLPAISPMKPEGTFLVWIDLSPLEMPSKEAFDKLIDAGVAPNPGFLFGSGGEPFIRLNIGCPKSTLIKGLEKFKTAFLSK